MADFYNILVSERLMLYHQKSYPELHNTSTLIFSLPKNQPSKRQKRRSSVFKKLENADAAGEFDG